MEEIVEVTVISQSHLLVAFYRDPHDENTLSVATPSLTVSN
jgi:hypothetical protein